MRFLCDTQTCLCCWAASTSKTVDAGAMRTFLELGILLLICPIKLSLANKFINNKWMANARSSGWWWRQLFSAAPHALGKSCAPCRILLWVWPTEVDAAQVSAETPGLLVGQVHRGLQLLPPSVRCDRDEVDMQWWPPRVFKHGFSGRMILFYLLSNAPYQSTSTLRHCCVDGDIRADREAIVNRCP